PVSARHVAVRAAPTVRVQEAPQPVTAAAAGRLPLPEFGAIEPNPEEERPHPWACRTAAIEKCDEPFVPRHFPTIGGEKRAAASCPDERQVNAFATPSNASRELAPFERPDLRRRAADYRREFAVQPSNADWCKLPWLLELAASCGVLCGCCVTVTVYR